MITGDEEQEAICKAFSYIFGKNTSAIALAICGHKPEARGSRVMFMKRCNR